MKHHKGKAKNKPNDPVGDPYKNLLSLYYSSTSALQQGANTMILRETSQIQRRNEQSRGIQSKNDYANKGTGAPVINYHSTSS